MDARSDRRPGRHLRSSVRLRRPGRGLAARLAARHAAGATRAGMPRESILHVDRDVGDAIALLRRTLQPGDVVLVKGRDTERLHRISLGLMGRKVACDVNFYQLKLVDCDFCTHLETGWGDRKRVP